MVEEVLMGGKRKSDRMDSRDLRASYIGWVTCSKKFAYCILIKIKNSGSIAAKLMEQYFFLVDG